jgi:peptide deformylase
MWLLKKGKRMIELYPAAILRKECSEIDPNDKYFITNICDKMKEIIVDFKALGLAANQIDYDARIVGICPQNRETPYFMINPKITSREGIFVGVEACLSFPGVGARVKRNTNITVEYFDKDAQEHKEEFFGEEAVIIQHEVDHINGITLAQSVSGVLRQKLIKDLKLGKRRFFKAMAHEAKLRKLKQFGK